MLVVLSVWIARDRSSARGLPWPPAPPLGLLDGGRGGLLRRTAHLHRPDLRRLAELVQGNAQGVGRARTVSRAPASCSTRRRCRRGVHPYAPGKRHLVLTPAGHTHAVTASKAGERAPAFR